MQLLRSSCTSHLPPHIRLERRCNCEPCKLSGNKSSVSPGNLLVEADWTVRVADFGLSRVVADLNSLLTGGLGDLLLVCLSDTRLEVVHVTVPAVAHLPATAVCSLTFSERRLLTPQAVLVDF